ncbi:MAG: endonuclease [Candidatus Cloacimonetes bacterium]|nr:endonuclease [Candidatus Cloacimonadota bacterium]
MKKYIVFVILLAAVLFAWSDDREVIAPDLNETELWNYLVDNYKTTTTLGYDNARDILYSEIDLQPGNILEGIYSGYSIVLDPLYDPSTYAYSLGIDCEHSWPQSYGADQEPQRSDMHHLYPSKSNVNSARSNAPFGEIPDIETDNWYRLSEVLTTIPTSNIDEYSEKDNFGDDTWEPREEVKGNIARSMFYFYTMYYDNIQNSFMDNQMDELYAWHLQDPADETEITRTWAIASYQQNKPNPFVIDDSLIERIWYYQNVNPLIFVTAPNGGEFWFTGNDYEITWTSQDFTENVNISLLLNGQPLPLASNISNIGSWLWNISPALETSNQYRIRIGSLNGSVTDDSDADFTIMPPAGEDDFVIISEYVEGSGFHKALEIFNGSDIPLDLNGWSLRKQVNGAGAFGNELLLSETIAPWNVFVVCYDNDGENDLTENDAVDLATNNLCLAFNGNDAIALYFNGAMVDLVGIINSPDDWGNDMTLVRNSSIDAPSLDYDPADWTQYPQDTFSFLGFHDYAVSVNYGDIDGNGSVEAYDAALVLQYVVMIISGWNEEQITAADVDGNGLIDSYDASLILRYVNGIITQFPIE